MDDLIKCLYEFTQAHHMGSLYQDEEYEEYSSGTEKQAEQVRNYLNEAQRMELQILMENISARRAIESEHLFQASLALARELYAIVRA